MGATDGLVMAPDLDHQIEIRSLQSLVEAVVGGRKTGVGTVGPRGVGRWQRFRRGAGHPTTIEPRPLVDRFGTVPTAVRWIVGNLYTDRLANLPPFIRVPVQRFDSTVDTWFTPLRGNPVADRVFYVASEAADYSKAWHAIGMAMALVSPSRRRDAVRMAVALGVESAFVNGLLKSVIPRERPKLLDDAAYEVRRPKTKSFPSGHASSACLTATLLSEAAPRLKPVWWSLAAVVSASRIHNRMHHPSDVVAGAALGLLMGRGVRRFWPLSR